MAAVANPEEVGGELTPCFDHDLFDPANKGIRNALVGECRQWRREWRNNGRRQCSMLDLIYRSILPIKFIGEEEEKKIVIKFYSTIDSMSSHTSCTSPCIIVGTPSFRATPPLPGRAHVVVSVPALW